MTVRTPTPAPRGATPALPSPTGATSHRVVLMAGVAAAVVVLAALLTGTAPRTPLDGLPDAGRLVGWGLRLGRAGLDLSLMATLGCLTVRLLLGPPKQHADAVDRLGRMARRWGIALATLAAVMTVLGAADLAGTSLWQVLGDPQLVMFAASYDLGRALLLLVAVGAVTAVVATRLSSPWWTATLLAVGCWSLGPLAAAGHTAAAGAHDTAVAGLYVHVLAASLWCGGLVGVWHLRGRPATLGLLAPRYSALALGCYVALAASGLVTAWTRVGFTGWWSTWGAVAVAKIVVLAGLGLVGHAHRRHTMPLLRNGRHGAFVRLVAAELLLVGIAVAAAVTLSRTTAPAGAAPEPGGEHVDALTGLPVRLPPPSDLAAMLRFRIDAPVLLLIAAAVVGYLVAVRSRLRAGGSWPRSATVSFVAGSALLVWAWCGPPAVYATATLSASYARALLLLVVVPALWQAGSPLGLWAEALHHEPPRLPRPGASTAVLMVAVVVVVVHSGTWLTTAQSSPLLRFIASVSLLVVGCLARSATGMGARPARILFAACLAGVFVTQAIALARDRVLLETLAADTGLAWVNPAADAAGLVACAVVGGYLVLSQAVPAASPGRTSPSS
ncbi:MAG TPA: CopD family protein [Nocardioides sp.]|nr:CopD family protein [Nocardioides sp.]